MCIRDSSTPVSQFTRRYPKRYFAKNELSPGLIRLSLLPTSHPLSFQPKWVRSSTQYNPRFNLLMGRSPGFASAACNLIALFTLGFPRAPVRKTLTLLHTTTRRIIMQKARCHPERIIGLQPLVGTWFQILFHSPKRGTFHLSLALLSSLSVIREYLALRDGPR